MGLYMTLFEGANWVPIKNNVAWAEAYLHAKFHLDPSIRLATIHQRYRLLDRQNRQRSDSIWRTVLQAVAAERCTTVVWPCMASWCNG